MEHPRGTGVRRFNRFQDKYTGGYILTALPKAQKENGLILRRRCNKRLDRDVNVGLFIALLGLSLAIIAPVYLGIAGEIF
jgi:hypothetical protein